MRKRIALKPDEWPTPDRDAWHMALVPGDLLEPGGLAAKWAPSTQSGVSTSYGRWLAWLTSGGRLDVELAPAARVTPKAVAGYVGYLREQHASSSAVAYLAFLVMALQAIAPDRDWAWLQRIVARLKMESAPAREKRPRLQDTDDLLAFGVKLMAEAEPPAAAEASPGIITWQRATQYRDGLMVALLALRPFRRKNFCAMEIGRHLVQRKGGYLLLFEAAETKNHRPLEIPFPAVLATALDRYMTRYRPWLCQQTTHRDPRFPFRPAGQHLWISKTGSALSPEVFYKGLRQRTAAHFGRSIHPHLFRDCAATSIATGDPEHVRIIVNVLGHNSMQTSERYYNHAGSVEAARKVHGQVLGLRRAAQADPQGRHRDTSSSEA